MSCPSLGWAAGDLWNDAGRKTLHTNLIALRAQDRGRIGPGIFFETEMRRAIETKSEPERFNRRVTLHRVLGCSSGYKTCEMVNQKVVILRDTYHGSNLRSGLGCFKLNISRVWVAENLTFFWKAH